MRTPPGGLEPTALPAPTPQEKTAALLSGFHLLTIGSLRQSRSGSEFVHKDSGHDADRQAFGLSQQSLRGEQDKSANGNTETQDGEPRAVARHDEGDQANHDR